MVRDAVAVALGAAAAVGPAGCLIGLRHHPTEVHQDAVEALWGPLCLVRLRL